MNAVQSFNLSSTASNSFYAYSSSAVTSDTTPVILVNNVEARQFIYKDKGKYSVFDVANWFLSKEEMTQKKMQKLCYYAQAWCFALKGYRLENTEYEAWVHGPVSPVLWERFKSFGYDPIRYKGKPAKVFEPEDLKLLEDVWDTYGELTGNALEALTHRELPWIEARKGYEPEERCSVVISPLSMATFYRSIYNGE